CACAVTAINAAHSVAAHWINSFCFIFGFVIYSSIRRQRPKERNRRLTSEAAIRFWLLARVVRGPDLRHDLIQVPALPRLKRRELLVALELLEPQQLADGQHVPVV